MTQTLTIDLLCVCPRPERLEPLAADQLGEATVGLCTVDPRLLFQVIQLCGSLF